MPVGEYLLFAVVLLIASIMHESTCEQKFTYIVRVTTANIGNASTDANVYLVIYGSKGETGEMHLKSSIKTTDMFERGQTDIFRIDVKDIGKIEKIRVRRDNTNKDPSWFLEDVRIIKKPEDEPLVFRFHRWVKENWEENEKELEQTTNKVTTTDSSEPITTTDSSETKTQTTQSTPKSSTTTKVDNYCVIFRPCENGGTCSDGSDGVGLMGYKCKCPEDFEGKDCSEPKTQTTKSTPKSSTTTKVDTYCSLYSPCKNDGVCIDGIGLMDYQCKCPMGFEGKDCLETTEQKVAKEIVLTDESCKRKVSIGIPQVKYVVTLRCEEGTIFVKSVAYGSGKHWNAWIEQIGKICDHQTHCKVAAKDDMLDYHFIRAYKRLIIVYECVTKMPSRLSGFGMRGYGRRSGQHRSYSYFKSNKLSNTAQYGFK